MLDKKIFFLFAALQVKVVTSLCDLGRGLQLQVASKGQEDGKMTVRILTWWRAACEGSHKWKTTLWK
jgi:hypothetical protein